MGILRNREELLPVTCAVLKENEREMFFNDVRRKAAGNMDRVAQAVGVPVTTLQDWVNGTANVPYITLQRLASEFEVEMPSVTELRREFQHIAPAQTMRPSARLPTHPGPIGSGPTGVSRTPQPPRAAQSLRAAQAARAERNDRKPRRERPERPARQERQAKPDRGQRRDQPKQARQAKPARPQQAAPQASGPRIPKLSDKVAYWTGAVFAAGRRDGDVLTVSAAGVYAGLWGVLTEGLFGVHPAVAPQSDGPLNEARLPVAGLEDFVNRLDLKPGANRPPAPRWAWSNPDWKHAFLKGLVDAVGELSDTTLKIPALGDPLRRSVEKLLSGLAVPFVAVEGGALAIEGAEALEKYWRAVGSENPALRDPLEARFPGAAPEAPAEPSEKAAAPQGAPRPEGRGRKRRRGRGRGRREGAPAQAAAPGGDSVPPPPSPEPSDDQVPEV